MSDNVHNHHPSVSVLGRLTVSTQARLWLTDQSHRRFAQACIKRHVRSVQGGELISLHVIDDLGTLPIHPLVDILELRTLPDRSRTLLTLYVDLDPRGIQPPERRMACHDASSTQRADDKRGFAPMRDQTEKRRLPAHIVQLLSELWASWHLERDARRAAVARFLRGSEKHERDRGDEIEFL